MFITKKNKLQKIIIEILQILSIFIEVYFDQMDHNRLDSMAKW